MQNAGLPSSVFLQDRNLSPQKSTSIQSITDTSITKRGQHSIMEGQRLTIVSKLRSYCESDSLSEEGLRAIILYERLTPNYHLCNYEFFYEACCNERVTEGIIRCLLEYFPDAARGASAGGWTPLHYACDSKNVTLEIIRLLIDAHPASVRSVTKKDSTPLHILCNNREVDDEAAIQIFKFLIEKCPDAARHANGSGILPIHTVAWAKSPEFCRVLIDTYPGSERMTDDNGVTPLHFACANNSLAMVEYLYKLYPDSINHASTDDEFYPIHQTINDMQQRDCPAAAIKIAQFLLDRDPNQKLVQYKGLSLLHFACGQQYNDSDIESFIQMIKVVFDAHPEAIIIEADEYDHSSNEVQGFLNNQLFYARRAKVHSLMTTPDANGRLPLHTAIQNNVRLGSIKLFAKGNPEALQSSDNSGALPLHVACQHHESVNVIQYLVELDQSTLDVVDREGNTALHLACQNARHDIITLLLEKYDAVSVSKRNANKKLPIDLLWESNAVEDRESIEYTESVYRLLRANPEMMMGIDVQMMQSSASTSSTLPCQVGKKRKFGM